jgi:hypothetical protein
MTMETPPVSDDLDLAALEPRLRYYTRPRHIRIPDGPSSHADAQRQAAGQPRGQRPDEPTPIAPNGYGHIEARIRAASVTDPGILVRAAALDHAGDELGKDAARLAAQDTPVQPAAPRAASARQARAQRSKPTSHRAASR